MASFQTDQAINGSTTNAAQYLLPCVSSSSSHAELLPQSSMHSQLTFDDTDSCFIVPDHAMNPPALERGSYPDFPNADDSLAHHYSGYARPLNNDSMQGIKPSSQCLDSQVFAEADDCGFSTESLKFIQSESPISHTSLSPIHPSCLKYSENAYHVPTVTVANSNFGKGLEHIDSSRPPHMPRWKRKQSPSDERVPCPSTDAQSELKLKNWGSQTSNAEQIIGSLDVEPATSEAEFKRNLKIPSRASHSLVERKYRHNLNSKMDLLGQTLALTHNFQIDMDPGEKMTSGKPPKAEILNRAMRYVKRAEIERAAYIKEIELLKARVAAYEKLDSRLELVQTPVVGTDMLLVGDGRQ